MRGKLKDSLESHGPSRVLQNRGQILCLCPRMSTLTRKITSLSTVLILNHAHENHKLRYIRPQERQGWKNHTPKI